MSDPREKTVLNLHRILNLHQPVDETDANTAFNKMLEMTVYRNTVSLNKIISRFLKRKIPHKQLLAQTILITATAELLLMDSPDYAVLNSYVAITKKHLGKAVGGFVNAILRQVESHKEEISSSYHPEFFPDAFRKILAEDYDSQTIQKIEQAALKQPPLNITVKENSDLWAEKLNGSVVNESTIALQSSGNIETIEGYKNGQWWVQDTAAALAVQQFSQLKGKRVLDLCAAPGGKTAQLINAGAKVTSLDCSEQRLSILKQNLSRLNFSADKIICADVLKYLDSFQDEPFDAVLLDAPCSATGVFRRHPELVHLKNAQDIRNQATLQQKILEKISITLKSGGELVYCVCSIAKNEGEKQIEYFLKHHLDFHIVPLQNKEDSQTITKEGFIRTLPFNYETTGGCDAFFIAKLIKD